MGFPGNALTASRASVATLAIFASRRASKTLVGEPPQTRLWDILSQSNLSASPSLTGLLLISLVVRQPAQMIHAALDRYQLPHILLGLAVFPIKSLFPRCQLAAFFF